MTWAVWVAIAAIAGVATFLLLRRPQENQLVSLTPIFVASAQVPDERPEPPALQEPIEADVATEAPEAAEVLEPSRMVSPMTGRMIQVPRVPTMSALTETQVPDSPPPPRQTPAMSAMAAGNANLPETPSRAEVQSALLAVRGSIRECMSRTGRVPVRVTVSGRTGQVTTATVQDAYFARQPTGGCIARAVRRARFPRFQRERLVIVYPYEF